MSANTSYGLEQARIPLPAINADADADVDVDVDVDMAPGLLALRSTGRGLWGSHAGQTIAAGFYRRGGSCDA